MKIEAIPAEATRFKETELGPLPEEWRVVRLGEVISLIRNGITKRQNKEHLGFPVTRIETIAEGKIDPLRVGYINDISEADMEKYKLKYGDILFSHINSEEQIGKSALYLGEPALLLHGMNLLLIRVSPSLDFYYLHYLFQSYRERGMFVAMAARAVGQASINQGKMKFLPIPLPPLPEQRAIAYVLRTVQEAKEATDRVIAALRDLKKSLMRHLFTYGPVPVGEQHTVPLQETEIGPLPAHWRVVRLGEVGKVITGRTPPTNRSEYWDGPIPFITPVDLTGRPIGNAQRSISYKGLQKAKRLPRNTVLVSCIGYIGKVGVVDSELAVTNQQINAVIPNQTIVTWFLAYALMNQTRLLESRARMTTVPILNKTNFARIPIPLPPLPEQQEIARMLQAVDARIEAEEKKKAALEALFKTLLHHLMMAKIRLPEEFVARFAEVTP